MVLTLAQPTQNYMSAIVIACVARPPTRCIVAETRSHRLQVSLLVHFYLNLCEANASLAGGSSQSSPMSDLHFARVLGDLAGSLSYHTSSSSTGASVRWQEGPDEEIDDEHGDDNSGPAAVTEGGVIEIDGPASSSIDSAFLRVEEVSRDEVVEV